MRRIAPRALGAALGLLALASAGLALSPAAQGRVMVAPPPPPRWDPRVVGRVVTRDDGAPPIVGGTLIVLRDQSAAVLSDPARDRLQIVELDHRVVPAVRRTVWLPRGAEPGRLVEGSDGLVHVALRGSGELASLDVRAGLDPRRVPVCPMPRGVAAAGPQVHVACRGGELVTVAAASGEILRRARLDRDLRDALVIDDALSVTRFRDPALLRVTAAGEARAPRRPRRASHDGPFANRVAWRTRAYGEQVLMLHQRAQLSPIPLREPNPYGGPRESTEGCKGIVRSALSVLSPRRAVGPELDGAPLPVDFDVRRAPDGTVSQLVVVAAGNQSVAGGIVVYDEPRLDRPGCLRGRTIEPGGHRPRAASAVAFTEDGRLLVQLRDPAALLITTPDLRGARRVPLAGESTFDTGHAIFHAATQGDLTCASCHPEGGDDGHAWRFSGIGRRRTPTLHAAAGSAPFHWQGELASMEDLMREVFVRRMGGPRLRGVQAVAVERWLGHLAPPRPSGATTEAAERGRALFEGSAGCAGCHGGPRLSNLASADVGTGGAFQVPALIGVADRLPLMHDGCATTLRQRFTPGCGGRRHNRSLGPREIEDLVAYLETL